MNSMNIFRNLSILVSSLVASSYVFADDAAKAAAPGGNPLGSGLIFVVIIVMMYFLMIRPQNKRAKEHRDLVAKVAKGDEVLTSGGIVGVIEKVTDSFVIVRVGEGMNLTIQRQAIAASVPKGTMKSI